MSDFPKEIHEGTCLDLILDVFDTLFKTGQFEAADELLQIMIDSFQHYPSMVLFAYFSATRAAHSKLPSRAEYVEKAIKVLEERGDLDERTISRLKLVEKV